RDSPAHIRPKLYLLPVGLGQNPEHMTTEHFKLNFRFDLVGFTWIRSDIAPAEVSNLRRHRPDRTVSAFRFPTSAFASAMTKNNPCGPNIRAIISVYFKADNMS